MSYGYIYIIEDLDNGKLYVGRHTGKFEKKYWGSGIHIKRAIKEKGLEHFARVLFCYCDDEEELRSLEYQLIIQLNTFVPFGYNLQEGGNSKI